MDGHFSERTFKRTPYGGGAPKARLGWHQSQPLNLCSQLGFQCGQARVVFTERLKLEGNINLHIFSATVMIRS